MCRKFDWAKELFSVYPLKLLENIYGYTKFQMVNLEGMADSEGVTVPYNIQARNTKFDIKFTATDRRMGHS